MSFFVILQELHYYSNIGKDINQGTIFGNYRHIPPQKQKTALLLGCFLMQRYINKYIVDVNTICKTVVALSSTIVKLNISLEINVAPIIQISGITTHLKIGVLISVMLIHFKILNEVFISSVMKITTTYPLIP